MRKKRIIDYALSKLSKTENELFYILTENSTKENFVAFLKGYDIDNEDAVSTFMINHLLERYSVSDCESPLIARIRGLKEYFHFHNVAAFKNLKTDKVLFDADLIMKCRFPDETRPFTSLKMFIVSEDFSRLFGRQYTKRIIRTAEPVRLPNREYLVPDKKWLSDLLYLNLFIALNDVNYRSSSISYLYDIHRYCDDKGLSASAVWAVIRNILRGEIGRRIKWLLK